MALTDVKSEQIQSSVALAGSPTTTTQSASDNSTKIATTAYVDTAVTNLVASAPAALNTLDELAAALNDDASFSTTVTNSIATKLPLAGGTLTGATTINGGNPALVISNSGDAKINFVRSNNTINYAMATTASGGHGFYDNAASDYDLYMKAGNVGIGTTNPSSSAGWGTLLEVSGTTNAGIKLTETDTSNGDYSLGTTAGTFRIWDETASTFRLTLNGSGNVGIGTSSPNERIHVHESSTPRIMFTDGTTGTTSGGDGMFIGIAGDQGFNMWNYENTYIRFAVNNSEKMRIDSSGNVGIGDSTPQALLDVGGGYGGNTSVATFAHATDAYIEIENMTTQNGAGIILTNAGTKKWTIQKDTSAHFLYIQDASNNALMTFTQSGTIGIGNSIPSSFNNSANNLVIGSGASGDNTGLTIYSNSNSSGSIHFADSTSGTDSYVGDIYYNHASNFMAFLTNATEAMRIDSSGNLVMATGKQVRNTQYQDLEIGAMNGDGSDTYIKSAGSEIHQAYIGSWTETMRIDDNGHITMPLQPAFLAKPSSTQSNIATGTNVQIALGTVVFDQGSDFASNAFTAPVTGKYQLNATIYMQAVAAGTGYVEAYINTSNRTYYSIFDPDVFDEQATYWYVHMSALADLDASDTAHISIRVNSGAAQTDISTVTQFSGFLAC